MTKNEILLFEACEKNNVELASKALKSSLFSKGANANTIGEDGCAPIILAARNGSIELVELLIANGADINVKNNDNETPLICAAYSNKKELVELLIAKGLEINAQNNLGNTPLLIAIENGYKEIANLLISKEANINISNSLGNTALITSIANFLPDIAKSLIELGIDINLKNNKGDNACNLAIEKGYVEITKILIEKGTDIDSMNRNGDTPIIQAIEKGFKDIIRFLVGKGANINLKRKDGCSPILLAARNSNIELTELLIANGADINTTDNSGETPFIFAYFNKKKELSKLLIDKGANINVTSNSGETPLTHAVKDGNIEMVKFLLANSADVNHSDRKGNTAIYNIAMQNLNDNDLNFASLLIDHGATIDSSMQWDGDTILNTLFIESVHEGNVSRIEKMLKQGMNPNFVAKISVENSYFTDSEPINEVIITALKYSNETSDKERRRSVGKRKSDVRFSMAQDRDFLRRESRIPDTISFVAMKEIIALLFKHGANPDKVNTFNVFYYCKDKTLIEEMIRLLIDNGVKNWGGYSLIHIFDIFGITEILDLLFSHGVDLNTPCDSSGLRLIHHVCKIGITPDELISLIKKGIDLNPTLAEDHKSGFFKGESPLIIATCCGHENLALSLIDNGVDTSITTISGKSAMSYAKGNGMKPVIAKLQGK